MDAQACIQHLAESGVTLSAHDGNLTPYRRAGCPTLTGLLSRRTSLNCWCCFHLLRITAPSPRSGHGTRYPPLSSTTLQPSEMSSNASLTCTAGDGPARVVLGSRFLTL